MLRLDMDSGEVVALSGAGVYLPGERLQAFPFDQPLAKWTPALSPDERWLALPDPAGGGVWLVDLMGEEMARKLLDRTTAVSWSPSGREIAWVDAGQVFVQELDDDQARPLAKLEGLLNVAWSPQGDTIAVAAGHADRQQVTLSLLTVQNGSLTHLVTARAVAETGRGFDLAWTEDGSEVWYAPAMIAYNVQEQSVRPLLSPNVFGGERRTMYAMGVSRNRRHSAWSLAYSEQPEHTLQINRGVTFDAQMEVIFELPWAAYAWTADEQSLIVQEGEGEHGRLWRINPEMGAPVFSLQAADAGVVLGTGTLIGTRSHLAQFHRQVAPRGEFVAMEPFDAATADIWARVPMQIARLSVEHPIYWNYNWPGYGDVATTLANFDITNGEHLLSLSPEWFYATFDAFVPSQGNAIAFLEQEVFAPEADAIWQEITIDGRTGYRVHWQDRPTHEEVFVPFEDNTIVHITKYPLQSEHDATFERILRAATWLPSEQWIPPIDATPIPEPTMSAAARLDLVGSLPALHWREGLALFAVTSQGELVRATQARIAFYDPVTLQELRTGLVSLAADITLNALSADGQRLARAVDGTVEILDLNTLNEQSDPHVVGVVQAGRAVVVSVTLSPDGKTLAVVSQAQRDDLVPALLEVFDMQRFTRYGEWEHLSAPRLAFSPDSRRLASWITSGAAPFAIYALDPAAGLAVSTIVEQEENWFSFAFSPDSRRLAAAAERAEIIFWTLDDMNTTSGWGSGPGIVVWEMAYDPSGELLALARPDFVELRRAGDGALLAVTDLAVSSLVFFRHDGRLLLAGVRGNGEVRMWQVND